MKSSRSKTVVAVATAIVLCLLGLAHVSDFHTHVTTRLTHRRLLTQLQDSPALTLSFHAKRDTMKIHGHSDFQVIVQPTSTNSEFEFNGLATFIDGDDTHTYTLVNGVAYYSHELPDHTTTVSRVSSELPPVHELLEALASATPIDTVQTTQTINCPASSQLFHARFSEQDFVLCGFESIDTTGVRVFGEDFNVDIHFSASTVNITKPTGVVDTTTTSRSLNSNIVPRSTLQVSTTTVLRALKDATSDSVARVLAPQHERKLTLQASTCGCKSTPRPCIFFHGMDIKADGGLVDNFDFFGDIKNHAPCCSSVKFAVFNTIDYAWNNASLVDKACDYALSMSPLSDKSTGTIENTIVVGHSMGNLMIAHAEASGKCKLGSTSSWVSLSGPFKGSMGSDFQEQVCSGDYFAKDIVAGIAALFGQCPQSKARAALYYQGGNFSSPTLTAQFTAARLVHQQRVTAGVCGFSYNGLPSGDGIGLLFGGTILPHKSKENDGVVEFQSCIGNLPSSQFGENWVYPFYRAKLNHADTTFKHGDAWFDNRQKPVKWFECLPL